MRAPICHFSQLEYSRSGNDPFGGHQVRVRADHVSAIIEIEDGTRILLIGGMLLEVFQPFNVVAEHLGAALRDT